MLKVPANYKSCGIKVYCGKCKRELTSNEKCSNGKSATSCQFIEKHKYKLIVCVPNTRNDRRCKVIDTKDFNIALQEMGKFKEELKLSGYHKVEVVKAVNQSLIVGLIADYLDYQSAENIPTHLKRKRSKDHINDCKRALKRLCESLLNKGYSINNIDVTAIDDIEVGIYHDYLTADLKLGTDVYNKHFRIMNSFYNWMDEFKNIKITNPFGRVVLESGKKVNHIITKEEFNKLIEITTAENGLDTKTNTNYYREWLVNGFKLGLETGTRREELVGLKWNSIGSLDEETSIFDINNLKVDRIEAGEVTGNHIRPIPITQSLKELLIELGYNEKKGTDTYVLERPEGMTYTNLMDTLSRGFSHFIKQITNRELGFKNLRKTYITHITMVMGDDANIFTGHTDTAVLKKHYLSQAYLSKRMNEFRMF